jgi:DNA-binding transcriptional regulator YdaS (Cro superfamily)
MQRRAFFRRPDRPRFDPAATAVAALGGATAVARILGIDPATVYRWTTGTGQIPGQHHAALQRMATMRGVEVALDGPSARLAELPRARGVA